MPCIYVHFGDRVTVRVPTTAAVRTVGDAAAAFLSSYAASDAAVAAGGPPPPAGVELYRGGEGSVLDASAFLTDVCVDRDDLTAVAVRLAVPQPAQHTAPGSTAATRDLPAPVDEADPRSGSGPASVWRLTPDDAASFLSRAAQLDESKRLAAANMVYDKVLSSLGMRSSHAPTCILALARNAVAIEQHEKALAFLRQGVDAHPNHVCLLASLGEVLLRLDRHADAARCLDTALRLSRGGSGGSGTQGGLTTHDIQVLCARALYGAGARQQAANVVMQVLRDTQEGHVGALVEYAAVSADQGHWGDVITSLLRVLSASPKHRADERVQAMLAAAASSEEGMRVLFDTVGGNGTTPGVRASALAFVASALKDAGAVAPAATVLQRAYSASPSPGLALALAHAREACLDTAAALDALRTWFHHAATASESSPHAAWLAACTHIVGGSPTSLPALPTSPGSARYEWLFTDAGFADPAAIPSPGASPPATAGDMAPAETLDALACAFTSVKLLFCGGALGRAAVLSAVTAAWVEATPGGNALHESPIRNEAAYGSCIHLLLNQHLPGVPPSQPEEQPLFVLGDSHILPCAWRAVTFRGKPRLLVPCLVTGVKAFHLRPSSCFYPKRQWERACSRLPSGCDVIVMVGEIDCREGMLRAIEKGCAPNLPAAARGVAQLLVDALVKHLMMGRSRCGSVLVHPVAPVLDVTRPMVTAFNAALGAAMSRARLKHPAVTWLGGDETGREFTGRLLTPDGAALKPQYVLDGTHLHPGYVADVLQDALSKCDEAAAEECR
jgi:tetratricopeptide (TPR) repeat protein